jgi:hypothetical protein
MSVDPADLPEELAQAGAMVDKMIEHLLERRVAPLAIASALLGGSMGLLARTLGNAALLSVLDQARGSVESGEFDGLAAPPAQGNA